MKKVYVFIILFTMTILYVKASAIHSKYEINIAPVYSNTSNISEPRDHSISADITGHTLTIEGLRTTDYRLLTKTKTKNETKTKAKVSSNSLGLRQQPWPTSNYKLSTDYKLYTERRMRYAATANFQL